MEFVIYNNNNDKSIYVYSIHLLLLSRILVIFITSGKSYHLIW